MIFNDIRNKADILFSDIESFMADMKTLQETRDGLEVREREIRELEVTILKRKGDVDETILSQKREREYIAAANLELSKREKKIELQKDQSEAVRLKLEEMEDKRLEIVKEQTILQSKRDEIVKLREDMNDLERQQSLLTKEKLIDRERKRLLDLREAKIAARERQLQASAQYLAE